MKEIEALFVENPLDCDLILQKVIDLGADFLGGEWKNVDKSQVTVVKILGGQSNHMFHVTSSNSAIPYLLRIHREGQNQFFTDIVNFAIFSGEAFTLIQESFSHNPSSFSKNIAISKRPILNRHPVYGFFDGGRMEEYLPSRTLSSDDVLKQEISIKIGKAFPNYHAINVPVPRSRQCFQIMRESLNEYLALGGGDFQTYPNNVTYRDHPHMVSVVDLNKEVDLMEKWANMLFEDTLVFCQNDLTCANILQLNSTNEIVFIDFEYATYNFRGYDLAMHLSETAVLRMNSPSRIEVNEEFTDNHPNLRSFCESYIDSYNKINNRTPADRFSEVERLIKECQFFWPITHLFWACLLVKLGQMECNNEKKYEYSSKRSFSSLLSFETKI